MITNNVMPNVISAEDLEHNVHYQIRKDSFFLDADTHEHYRRNGWCKVQNVVTPAEIESFMNAYKQISSLEGYELGNQFMNTGCLHNPEIRNKTSEVINNNVQTILPRMFDMNKVASHTGGAFVIKPPHDESGLESHQDSSFIDEEKDYCLFMWVPFCDVNETNGAISVLPGSHLWGNTQRGFSVPWNLQKHTDILKQYMFPVAVNAGDVLIFDPALIHSSNANLSDEIRHAITITVVRNNPQLIYYYKDSEMPEDVIDKFYVDEDFFKTYDFASKPDEAKWKKTEMQYKSFDMSANDLVALIEKHLP